MIVTRRKKMRYKAISDDLKNQTKLPRMKSIKTTNKNIDRVSTQLVKQVTLLVIKSKSRIAFSVNKELTLLNWNIGRLIFLKVLEEEKAPYGQQIVATLSQLLMQ